MPAKSTWPPPVEIGTKRSSAIGVANRPGGDDDRDPGEQDRRLGQRAPPVAPRPAGEDNDPKQQGDAQVLRPHQRQRSEQRAWKRHRTSGWLGEGGRERTHCPPAGLPPRRPLAAALPALPRRSPGPRRRAALPPAARSSASPGTRAAPDRSPPPRRRSSPRHAALRLVRAQGVLRRAREAAADQVGEEDRKGADQGEERRGRGVRGRRPSTS